MKLDSKHIFLLIKKESLKCSFIACLTLTIILIFLLSNSNKTIIKLAGNDESRANTFDPSCDLFKGRWVRESRGPLYTNNSCSTIPANKNCLSNGRNDTGFLYWRWKPEQCELPRFSPEKFLESLQGKTMAFIGDSLARNQMESLLCLLSTVETPKQTRKDAENRFATWEFPNRNFTLMALWSRFLVSSTERVVNGSTTGSFDIHLDRVDPAWSESLPTLDYAVFSDTPWFIRENYLYEGGRLVGCTYCRAHDVPNLDPTEAVRKAFRTAFQTVNQNQNQNNQNQNQNQNQNRNQNQNQNRNRNRNRNQNQNQNQNNQNQNQNRNQNQNQKQNRNRTFSLLRTYSHSHYENGTWNNGGVCDRTGPTGGEVEKGLGVDWVYRKVQVEEAERGNSSFAVVDVTGMMSVRKDGHPGVYWKVGWTDGYRDCVHWCLPGPIDVWNELLFELINRDEMRRRKIY